jgi:hypothetical protein
MTRGVISKPGKFERIPEHYHAVLMRRQKPDENHGKWERICGPQDRGAYIVLCPNPHEAHELVRYVGPRAGFTGPYEYIDDRWEEWVLRTHLRIEHYGKPKGIGEMLYAEFIRGWYPSEDLLRAGRRSSPGIIDGVMEPCVAERHPHMIASAIAASMGF